MPITPAGLRALTLKVGLLDPHTDLLLLLATIASNHDFVNIIIEQEKHDGNLYSTVITPNESGYCVGLDGMTPAVIHFSEEMKRSIELTRRINDKGA